MAAFLCFMGVRLLEMHRILRDDGSIYLHCDTTAGHYLKTLMDAIFGARYFQSDITWKRTSSHNDSKRWGQVKDTILYYTKSNVKTWNPIHVAHDESYLGKFYRHGDERGRYRLHEAIRTASMGPRPNLAYDYKGFTPEWGWRMERSKLEALDSEGRLVWSNTGRPYRKTYLPKGQSPTNLWTDIQNVSAQSKERTGYPTQKPLTLYERLILASSNPGDIVLGPFCGCATTPVAAEHLGRQWVGIDIWDDAYQTVLNRMAKEGLIAEDAEAQPGQQTLTVANINYETKPPERTDHGETAVLQLRTPTGRRAMRFPPPRSQHGKILLDTGPCCQGCGRDYSFDTRVLEVDHIRPKSDGGMMPTTT